MFVGHEVLIDLGFGAARVRLANLARGGWMDSASQGAYGDGIDSLVRVGPLGDIPGMSKLVRVQSRELLDHEDSAVLTLRWEATGAGGALFPVLDADITLTPAGEHATRLALAGAYRAPLGPLGAGLDRAVLRHVAAATVGSLLRQVASALCPAEGEADTAGRPFPVPPRLQTER
jgi:hypothetical protein